LIIEDEPISKFQCWETYVGSAVYKLVVSDFLFTVVITLCVELPRK